MGDAAGVLDGVDLHAAGAATTMAGALGSSSLQAAAEAAGVRPEDAMAAAARAAASDGIAGGRRMDLAYFEFLGRVMGKAVFEGVLVDLPFAGFFLSKLLGTKNLSLDALKSLDAEIHKSLMYVKNCDESEIELLDLTFTVASSDPLDATKEEELVPGGSNRLVTAANRIDYVYRVADHHLNRRIAAQSAAFLRGFHDLIAPSTLRMFGPRELQMIISGGEGGLDLEDMKANTVYSGAYSESHEQIQWFWDIMTNDWGPSEHQALLKFITSCPRPPLLGFSHVNPKLCLQCTGPADQDGTGVRLPSSATCMNLLKLPLYSSREELRDKLGYAINSNSGFGLS